MMGSKKRVNILINFISFYGFASLHLLYAISSLFATSKNCKAIFLAERVGFEPTVELLAPQLLSRQLPSTDSATSPGMLRITYSLWPVANSSLAMALDHSLKMSERNLTV